jgi:hypothetical protein
MSTLSEIEAATESLPAEQLEKLMLFLAERLRRQRSDTPAPRRFDEERIASWVARDEAEMEQFRRGK